MCVYVCLLIPQTAFAVGALSVRKRLVPVPMCGACVFSAILYGRGAFF